jgi:hypothetical protein
MLMGVKFMDSNNETLLATEFVDLPYALEDPALATQLIQLAYGERLLAIRSSDRGWKQARHHNLQFLIGRKDI